MRNLYIGLMSGTSLDGIDGVVVEFDPGSSVSSTSPTPLQVTNHAYAAFPADVRRGLLELNASGPDELHRAALAANQLAQLYARVVGMLLVQSGLQRDQIVAIGAHGQTVRHQPQNGYTLQLNNPALLAELTGIDVVADFRSRDVAAGGQGAPLVPAFHREVFGQPDKTVSVLNIGGISNVSVLPAQASDQAGHVIGLDCGPGNALMDYWCHKNTSKTFDSGGQWAASGQVHADLLKALLNAPYFQLPAPKSTGRDEFNPAWLAQELADFSAVSPVDVQTTLTELTAIACARDVLRYSEKYKSNSKLLIVCGGGMLNSYLIGRLRHHLPDWRVESSSGHGLPPLQVEAAAFAWLARKTMRRETGNLPKVTGAQGARILGAIYPA
jgi:anhydro-N-acetylmuramic acid kinase